MFIYIIWYNHILLLEASLLPCGDILLTGYNGTFGTVRHPEDYQRVYCRWKVHVAASVVRYQSLTKEIADGLDLTLCKMLEPKPNMA